MHSFEVHSNESVCRKKVCLGLEQVINLFCFESDLYLWSKLVAIFEIMSPVGAPQNIPKIEVVRSR